MKRSSAYLSFPGGRQYNEDAVYVKGFNNKILAIIADGLGGHSNGDIASKMAVSVVSGFLKNNSIKGETLDSEIRASISEANSAIIKNNSGTSGVKTTAVVLYIKGNQAVCAHLGDSRLYHFRKEKIIFQTRDHSVTQMAVSVGEISFDEIRGHVDRNKLLRVLGDTEEVASELSQIDLLDGDSFLLCSDGFWELISEDEMQDDLVGSHDAKIWLEKMYKRVKSRVTDSSDNYSAITLIL